MLSINSSVAESSGFIFGGTGKVAYFHVQHDFNSSPVDGRTDDDVLVALSVSFTGAGHRLAKIVVGVSALFMTPPVFLREPPCNQENAEAPGKPSGAGDIVGGGPLSRRPGHRLRQGCGLRR